MLPAKILLEKGVVMIFDSSLASVYAKGLQVLVYATDAPRTGEVFYSFDGGRTLHAMAIRNLRGSFRGTYSMDVETDNLSARITRDGKGVKWNEQALALLEGAPPIVGATIVPLPDHLVPFASTGVFVGYTDKGIYVYVQKIPGGNYQVNVGGEGQAMRKIPVTGIGDKAEPGLDIPNLSTEEVSLYIYRGVITWGNSVLHRGNCSDYDIKHHDNGTIILKIR
jgi:hypothetical protein